ncbi:PREDICTED: E3 ubiquitin-protein ligase MBR1-like [Erythranthe guttata]|nr:PREDICTED: E3 ubiquitin-protein ligase MBR1-like [Erythranthe guttata]|eukprot:XP_012854494.1 PREDICTED: E3 ubiquitin-protein ligase MBR1-like [Erythranthe guttata]
MRRRLHAHMVPVVLIPVDQPGFIPNYPRFDPSSLSHQIEDDYYYDSLFFDENDENLIRFLDEEEGGGNTMTFGGNNIVELSEETMVAQLSEETIVKNLRTRASSMEINDVDYEQEVCVVCLDDLFGENEKVIATLGCGHVYHVECIKNWLLRKNECPMCKSKALVFD